MPLVGVRQEVVAEAEHAFGNLFHRLHYVAQKLQAQGTDGAATLEGTVTELEDLLRLVLDYISPLAIELREVGAPAVLGSLGAAFGQAVMPPADDGLRRLTVYADAGHLSQAFQLMKLGLAEGGAGDGDLAPGVEAEEGVRWLQVAGHQPGRNGLARGRGLVLWALAQKLIEAQGGTLNAEAEEGGVRWSVRLPLPSE